MLALARKCIAVGNQSLAREMFQTWSVPISHVNLLQKESINDSAT
jgi:hypothetical protein